jgi:hypothetical protein
MSSQASLDAPVIDLASPPVGVDASMKNPWLSADLNESLPKTKTTPKLALECRLYLAKRTVEKSL